MNKPNRSLQYLWSIIVGLTLSYAAYQGWQLCQYHKIIEVHKADLAEINKINYGLFDISRWKKEALSVFDKRIDEFEISEQAYVQVKKELEKYLREIDKKYIVTGKVFEPIFVEAEQNPKINKVFLKLLKDNTVPQIKELNIPKFIPGMAVDMADELRKQEPQLRDIMREELHKMIKDTTLSINDPRRSIYTKYNQTDHAGTVKYLKEQIDTQGQVVDRMVRFVYGILVCIFLLSWASTIYVDYTTHMGWMTASTIIMLLIGITLPMISIEGLLNAFTINVLGTDINFDQQYMYYQSKSILDVTHTLLQSSGFDTRIVGWMILGFSVVFPLTKLIVTLLYLYSDKMREKQLVQNMIFYLGKWSMADVFVVALFMAYIGFYGIITAQLSQIERNRTGFAVETINNSHMGYGALFFTTFCIGSIIIGIIINRSTKSSRNE